jgi:hypothetical protein
MTQDEMIELAKQAGFEIELDEICISSSSALTTSVHKELVAFAKLAIAKEREACAKVVDDWSDWHGGTELIAAVIRERGQA